MCPAWQGTLSLCFLGYGAVTGRGSAVSANPTGVGFQLHLSRGLLGSSEEPHQRVETDWVKLLANLQKLSQHF